MPARHVEHWNSVINRMASCLPWYQPWLLRAAQGASAGEGGLSGLPLITADVLEEHYYSEINLLHKRNDLYRYLTSGTSSGRRKAIYYTEADEENYLRIKLDVFRTILGEGVYRTALADMGTGHAEATALDVFRRLGMKAESVSFRLPVEQHLERLAEVRPEVLYTMPSILNRLLMESPDPSAYGIRHVVLVGEIAPPLWIQAAAERLGIGADQITDTYGSIEIGTIAYFSHEHGRYLFAEGIHAEGVQPEEIHPELEPLVHPDEQVLVLTSRVREAFPALRYVTYDIVRDLRPVTVGGEERQSFQSIVRRIGPDLKHGEKISVYDIENVVYRHLTDAGVRIKVTGNALHVLVYSNNVPGKVLEAIRLDLERHIPEIGHMISAGILERMEVTQGEREQSYDRFSIKNKKIIYE
ncbi:CoF synthetase [Paenibacillus gansuensis]|uniref:CoF synthetase n=1 Tax=Paenibacillus gansuensis TaxID=306542 RepID=A0ABW5PJG1_9BACL